MENFLKVVLMAAILFVARGVWAGYPSNSASVPEAPSTVTVYDSNGYVVKKVDAVSGRVSYVSKRVERLSNRVDNLQKQVDSNTPGSVSYHNQPFGGTKAQENARGWLVDNGYKTEGQMKQKYGLVEPERKKEGGGMSPFLIVVVSLLLALIALYIIWRLIMDQGRLTNEERRSNNHEVARLLGGSGGIDRSDPRSRINPALPFAGNIAGVDKIDPDRAMEYGYDVDSYSDGWSQRIKLRKAVPQLVSRSSLWVGCSTGNDSRDQFQMMPSSGPSPAQRELTETRHQLARVEAARQEAVARANRMESEKVAEAKKDADAKADAKKKEKEALEAAKRNTSGNNRAS